MSTSADSAPRTDSLFARHGSHVFREWSLATDSLWWSDGLVDILGHAPSETLRAVDGWIGLIHPTDLDRVTRGIRSLTHDGAREWSAEYRIRRGDDTYIEVFERAHLIRDADGTAVRVVSVMHDVDRIQRAEAHGRLQAERLALATDAASIGVWDWDLTTDHWFASSTYFTMLGYVPTDAAQDRDVWLQRLHAGDRPRVKELIRSVLLGECGGYSYDARMLHADGVYRWVHVVGRVLSTDQHGKPTRMIGVRTDISERMRTERALHERERLLSEAERIGRVGCWQFDIANDAVTWSAELYRIFGCSPSAITATLEGYFSLVHPDDRERTRALVARAFTHHQPYDCEERIVQPGGDARVLHSRGQVVLNPEGEVVGLVGVCQDITERKHFEHNIQRLNRMHGVLSDINQAIMRERDSMAMLQSACDIAVGRGRFSTAWIGLIDSATGTLPITVHAGATEDALEFMRTTVVDSPSGGLCAITGRAAQEGTHGVCNDIRTDPRALPWREGALRLGLRSVASLPLKAEGRVIGVLNLYANQAEFFDEGELRLLDRLASDISFGLEVNAREARQRQVEAAFRESEERFRQLAENIHEVFWMTDVEKRQIIYVSPAYERVWMRSAASLYESPMSWLEDVHPDDRDRVRNAALTRQANGTYDETYRIVRGDGSNRWIHDRAFPIMGSDGVVRRVVGTAEDITHQRQLEEQFRQSQKMEAIGQLAGGVAHDFNNILAAIMMQADLASVVADSPDDTRELLNDIKAATERAANLTRQLLAFSRRQVMQPRPLNLNDAVTSLSKMLQRTLGADVNLQLTLHPTALIARADAGMIDQVLLNLVVNARDAMAGGGTLTIETGRKAFAEQDPVLGPEAPPGGYVYLSVQDTGCGIEPENVSKIFEPFFTTKGQGKGTGLGLATVFGIARQHGGFVAVESVVHQGTTFHVFFPEISDSNGVQPEIFTSLRPPGGTETILLVEDEPAVRTLTRVVLERAGYTVIEAPDGVIALQLWEENEGLIRLLLTDIVMPSGINGLELAAQLQARDRRLRVIFTSGYSAEIAGRELSLRDGQNFIQKPCLARKILETVRACLDG